MANIQDSRLLMLLTDSVVQLLRDGVKDRPANLQKMRALDEALSKSFYRFDLWKMVFLDRDQPAHRILSNRMAAFNEFKKMSKKQIEMLDPMLRKELQEIGRREIKKIELSKIARQEEAKKREAILQQAQDLLEQAQLSKERGDEQQAQIDLEEANRIQALADAIGERDG